jgi:hypothetical protein
MRSVERDIALEEIRAVYIHGDKSSSCRDGKFRHQLSKKAVKKLRYSGLSRKDVRQVRDLVLVISPNGTIVTVWK